MASKRRISPKSLPKMRARAEYARSKRSTLPPSKRTRPVSVSLNSIQVSQLQSIGEGNITKGVKKLLTLFHDSIDGTMAVEQESPNNSPQEAQNAPKAPKPAQLSAPQDINDYLGLTLPKPAEFNPHSGPQSSKTPSEPKDHVKNEQKDPDIDEEIEKYL